MNTPQPIDPKTIQTVAIRPVPTGIVTGVADTPDGRMVMIMVQTPCGTTQVFIDVDQATNTAESLRQCAEQARTGIQIAKGLPNLN